MRALQFTMDMAGSEAPNMPKSFSLNMFKDIVPMGIFSETTQGEFSEFVNMMFLYSPL